MQSAIEFHRQLQINSEILNWINAEHAIEKGMQFIVKFLQFSVLIFDQR